MTALMVFKEGRQRPADYIAICNNIADSYPSGRPHGVQKDAIQNALDAARGRGPVQVQFELIENSKGRFFTITDSNTTGLTGPVLRDFEDYDQDLPEEYHWARFEAFAFTKANPDAIGARGQGKFMFLSVSKNFTMFYDTLRDDGIYRLGATQAQHVGCPILPPSDAEPWEGERAAQELKDRCGLSPLNKVGSRIIILEPTDELLQQAANGEFLRAIMETWFRAIEKNRLVVTVSAGKSTQTASLPQPYPLVEKDSSFQKVWILGKDFKDDEIRLSTGERYKIKHFHTVYLKEGTVQEELQGISIIQNGMKIVSLPTTLFPTQVRERVTGFIELDRSAEQELRKAENQDPNHYDLKWRRRLPHAIKEYVNAQLDTFGKAKLGLGADPREIRKRRRSSAEEWAMRQLQRFAADLDLFGGKGRRFPPRPSIPSGKVIGVSINNFTFPDPEIAPRVNWGHRFSDLGVTTFNRTPQGRDLALGVSVFRGDADVLRLVDHKRFSLGAGDEDILRPFEVVIDPRVFDEMGEYRLVASLFDATTGDRIDSVGRRFWVEKDPPLRRPFEIQPVDGFPEPYQKRQWMISGSINNSATLLYNIAHPAYRLAEEDEEQQGDYLLEMVLAGAVQFVLGRPDQEDGRPDYHPLDAGNILGLPKPLDRGEVPSAVLEEVHRYLSEVRWRMLEGA